MTPIVVCTVGSPALAVMEASVKVYAPEAKLLVSEGKLGSFGADYNDAMERAFKVFDEIIIANDDIVLTPHSYKTLLSDVEMLRNQVKLGLVGARSDAVRPLQDIRCESSYPVKEVPVLSPLFAWMSRQAFEASRFPPLNWFSDDVLCLDLMRQGFRHFVSRSYVHHAGSTSIGHDHQALTDAAKPWIVANRPEYAQQWGMA